MGYVYLLIEINEVGLESYKIGISKNDPVKRLKQLQTGNSNKIDILKVYESKGYKMVEKWLHAHFNTQQTMSQNEWFKLSNEDVFNFMSLCKKGDEITSFMLKENHFFKD